MFRFDSLFGVLLFYVAVAFIGVCIVAAAVSLMLG